MVKDSKTLRILRGVLLPTWPIPMAVVDLEGETELVVLRIDKITSSSVDADLTKATETTETETEKVDNTMSEGTLEGKWQLESHTFVHVLRQDFNQFYYDKLFVDGPIVESPSKLSREYGPYNPNRWAFGRLSDGRFVCCGVAS